MFSVTKIPKSGDLIHHHVIFPTKHKTIFHCPDGFFISYLNYTPARSFAQASICLMVALQENKIKIYRYFRLKIGQIDAKSPIYGERPIYKKEGDSQQLFSPLLPKYKGV